MIRHSTSRSSTFLRLILAAGCSSAAFAHAEEVAFPADQLAFFESNIRPVLAENCYSCHGAEKQKNGLRLDSRDAILRGSDYGAVVQPGQPAGSKLIQAIKHVGDVEAMPKGKPALSGTQIAAFERWIQMGVPWPKEVVASGKDNWKQHWAFQPVRKPELPANAKDTNPIDALLQKKLSTAGLEFAEPASTAVLCRRLYLGVTGLPPSFEELQTFVQAAQKDRAAATSALVDQLLKSPRYGERWGRYWLDIARYSDTEGYTAGGKDNRFPHAYTFRDWVVKSLNDDLPYDKFIMQQLAADRMASATDPSLAALGFLTVNDTFLTDHVLQIDDRIDVVSRGLLGLTVGCARCHDHKYDPIPSKDYYSFYSIFNSSEQPATLPIIGQPSDKEAVAHFQKKVSDIQGQMEAFRGEVFEDLRKSDRLRDYLLFAKKAMDLSPDAFRGAAGKDMVRDRIASRWRDFLKTYAMSTKPHPVMAAWKAFSELQEQEFEQKAIEVSKRLSDAASPINPVVRNELAKRPAPKSMTDVAAMYADVFVTCIAGQEPNNADWQAVRQILSTEMSPMSIKRDTIEHYFTRKDREHMTKLENGITALELSEPGAPLRAMVMEDKPKPQDVHVFIRGNPSRQGPPAPRGFLTLLGGQKFTTGSGRLELAQLIASKDNPLTARVIVNRVWLQHFGKPLVSQTSDFGVQTPKPEQAELLDYLAATFMEEGWSLKKLHRLILTSRAYQQSSKVTPQKAAKDVENSFVSHFNRQRLDYEGMRDSVLAACGTLNLNDVGGHSTPQDAPTADTRRSVYLFVDRYEQATVPAMFDFANPDTHSPQRFVTTVPQQALFLMNSPFMKNEADKLAAALPVEGSTVDSQTVGALYKRVMLRQPKPAEVEMAQRFLSDAHTLQEATGFAWRYGSAQVKRAADGKVSVEGFTEFPHFVEHTINPAWRPSAKMPDPKLHYVFWGNTGGHAGDGDTAASAQWTAPYDAEIQIRGNLARPAAAGDGVHGWIISSRTGGAFDSHVAPQGTVPMTAKLPVKKGDVITFAVTCEGDTNSDAFNWTPVIERILPNGNELITDARRDFCGPTHWPLNRSQPQSPLSQLVQVLLMSNEFQFVE